METRDVAAEVARLNVVRTRVRTLARKHPWFADAIRSAFLGFLDLCERCGRQKLAMEERELQLARALLAQGRVFDRKVKRRHQCLDVLVTGLCPVDLANQIGKYGGAAIMPRKLERESAATALAAMDRDVIRLDPGLPRRKLKVMAAEYCAAQAVRTHVEHTWRITVLRPKDWQEPPDPRSCERTDLEQFTNEEYRTVALHKLGALADAGASRPIVTRPKKTRNRARNHIASVVWEFRIPVDYIHRDQPDPPLDPQALPPSLAEEMLEDLEQWIQGELIRRGEAQVGLHDDKVPTPSLPAAVVAQLSTVATFISRMDRPEDPAPVSGPKPRRVKQRGRSKADLVRSVLSGNDPYEGSKRNLAAQVGYTHQASLDRVRGFKNHWEENERKLAERRAIAQKRMTQGSNR